MSESTVLAERLKMPRSVTDPVLARPEEAARHLGITLEELKAEVAAGRIQQARLSQVTRRIPIKSVLDYERRRRRGEFRPPEPPGPLDIGIYFVQAGPRGPIKIGYSAGVSRRIRHLQVASAKPLQLLNVRAGTIQQEARLQVKLGKYRLQGEWFRPVAQVLEEVYR